MAGYFKNTVELQGNISYIERVMQDRSGKDFQYVKVAQNENNKSKYFSLYLSGEMLKKFQKNYKVGSSIHLVGKLDSYLNKNKQTVWQIVPSEFIEVQKEKKSTEEKIIDMDV